MIKIKICGITNQEDAQLAAQLGAWAAGFIFTANSPRYIEPDKAKTIIAALPANIEKIGVFVDSSLQEIQNIVLKTGITQIQLHGNESPEFCANVNKLGIPIIKAVRVEKIDDISVIIEYKNIISAVLLDTYLETQLGGTGKSFDWNIAKKAKLYEIPVILAGGINSDNIAEAYLKVKPYAIDVSSGVEKNKGIKDHSKLRNLFLSINDKGKNL